jgi:hypothetical protein
MRDASILKQRRWLWPAVLIPYDIDSAHVRVWTGRAVLRDMKVSLSRATVVLTNEHLVVKGLFLGRDHLRVSVDAITSVGPVHGKRGVIEVEFSDAHWGKLALAAMSGQPPAARNRAVLNVDDPDRWISEIRLLI